MHLCLRTDRAAAMSSDAQARLENGRRAEPDRGDSPRGGGEDVELLCCRDATELGAPFKFRRYG